MRSFIVNLNVIGLLAVCLFACNHHSSNLLLYQVDSLLNVKPDSALTVLRSISVLDEMTEADRAYYALLMAEAMDKNELPLLPCDSLLDFALDYYGDDDKEMAVALLYKGRLLAQMNDEKGAIENNLLALEVLQDYPKDVKYRRLLYSSLGLWYGDCGLYDKALEVLNQSLHYSYDAKDTAIAYHNIGYVYTMRDLQDSSIAYQRKAVEYAVRSKDTSMMVTSWHGLSLYYERFDNTDSAVVYARKVLQHISDKHKTFGGYFYNMGKLYIDLEQYDSARYYLGKSLLLSGSQAMPYWSLSVMEAELGNFQLAYHYLDTFVMIQDSLDAGEELSEVQHLVYKHQTELGIREEQRKSRMTIGLIVFVAVVIFFVMILVYQYRINRKNRQEVLYQQSLEYTNDKLRTMQRRIEENEAVIALLQDKENKNLDEISKRERLITQLEKEKIELQAWQFQQTPIYRKVMALANQDKTDKKHRIVFSTVETDKLKKVILGIYSAYVSSLQAKCSGLTEDDLFFLCLEQTGLSSLTVALCLGFSDTQAINQRRSRIKRKLSEV